VEITNKYNLPATLVNCLQNDPYFFEGDYSTTTLIGPPQIAQLKRRYASKITVDASELIFALIGNNTHHILERINIPDILKEKRFSTSVLGCIIGGQIDLYEKVQKALTEYKVTSVWAAISNPKPEWEKQLNVNACLMRKHGIQVDQLQVVAILRDWAKSKASEHNYPDCQVKVIKIPKWSDEAAENYIRERVALHKESERLPDADLPHCSDEERWMRPNKWAVMRDNRVSAVRVLDTHEEACEWLVNKGLAEPAEGAFLIDKSYQIVCRPGANVRCESYCNVQPFCQQYEIWLKPPF
jgi:hypothetical protein